MHWGGLLFLVCGSWPRVYNGWKKINTRLLCTILCLWKRVVWRVLWSTDPKGKSL